MEKSGLEAAMVSLMFMIPKQTAFILLLIFLTTQIKLQKELMNFLLQEIQFLSHLILVFLW
jgi:hypothetical protein